jgi:beta-lactamase class D
MPSQYLGPAREGQRLQGPAYKSRSSTTTSSDYNDAERTMMVFSSTTSANNDFYTNDDRLLIHSFFIFFIILTTLQSGQLRLAYNIRRASPKPGTKEEGHRHQTLVNNCRNNILLHHLHPVFSPILRYAPE